MPELPEVETIKRSLQKAILGKKIKNIKVLKPKIFKGDSQEVIGSKILDIQRRAKILIVNLSGDKSLVFHFKLTGQLVWVEKGGESVTLGRLIPFAGSRLPAKTTHVIFEINGGRLFYNDLRQFGWIKIIEKIKMKNEKSLKDLGPEPFSREFSDEYLRQVFSKTSRPVKLVLMDQTKIAGIGNIYANEALFEAGILPERQAKELSNEEIEKLRVGIIKVLDEGLKYGGSSAEDEAYIKPNGTKGAYQEHFKVYQREEEPCIKCGTKIKRIALGGRGTFFCPKCQK